MSSSSVVGSSTSADVEQLGAARDASLEVVPAREGGEREGSGLATELATWDTAAQSMEMGHEPGPIKC